MTAQAEVDAQAAVDWQDALDDYLAATRRQEALAAEMAKAGRERAEALAAMSASGKSDTAIGWIVGLSRARVGQMIGPLRTSSATAPCLPPPVAGDSGRHRVPVAAHRRRAARRRYGRLRTVSPRRGGPVPRPRSLRHRVMIASAACDEAAT